jgi:hypothetical protein
LRASEVRVNSVVPALGRPLEWKAITGPSFLNRAEEHHLDVFTQRHETGGGLVQMRAGVDAARDARRVTPRQRGDERGSSTPTVIGCSSKPSKTGSPVVFAKSAIRILTEAGVGGSGRSAMIHVPATMTLAAAAAVIQKRADFRS